MRSCQRCLRVGARPEEGAGIFVEHTATLYTITPRRRRFVPGQPAFRHPRGVLLTNYLRHRARQHPPLPLRSSLVRGLPRFLRFFPSPRNSVGSGRNEIFLWNFELLGWTDDDSTFKRSLGWHFAAPGSAFSTLQMLPFEIREQLNLTLARPYLTFKASAQT